MIKAENSGCAIADFNVKLLSCYEKETGKTSVVNAATSWDKRTYNSIVVEGDDQKWVRMQRSTNQIHLFGFRWAWLEDGEMKELLKKSRKVQSMDVEDENENIAMMFEWKMNA